MPKTAFTLSANSSALSDLSKTMFPLAPVNVVSPSIVNPVSVPKDVIFVCEAVCIVPVRLPVTFPVKFPVTFPVTLPSRLATNVPTA